MVTGRETVLVYSGWISWEIVSVSLGALSTANENGVVPDDACGVDGITEDGDWTMHSCGYSE